MLFKVHHAKDIKELNPSIDAIAEFEILTSRQMTFVVLVADYESPFRTLPDRDKRDKSARAAGYQLEANGKRLDINGRNVVDKKNAKVETAIVKYKEIQYDEQKAMVEAIDAQIQEAMDIMAMDKSKVVKKTFRKGDMTTEEYYTPIELSEKAIKLGTRLAELRETKQKILSSVQTDKDVVLDSPTVETFYETSVESEEPMSTLDMVMAKKMSNDVSER